jgi:tetratricopeptide (TPR) repeat protein
MRTARAASALLAALAVVLVLGAAEAAVTPPASGPVGEAWAVFSTFHEDLARIDRAREILDRAVAREPSLDALLLLSWVHLSWGDLRTRAPEEKLASYERGRDTARRAIELAPQNSDAHLWYGANLGRWAITKGKLRAAFLASTIREALETAVRLNPGSVGALAALGTFYRETPGFMGGDVGRAEQLERQALALDGHFTRARVELSRVLIEQKRFAEARRELQQVLDEKQASYVADWVIRHKPLAERLLGEIRGKS